MKHNERSQLQSKNSPAITEAGIKRSRILRSCNGCRQAKTKCSGARPSCLRCQSRNLKCVYDLSVSAKRDEARNHLVATDQPWKLGGSLHDWRLGGITPTDTHQWSGPPSSGATTLAWYV
ncbi:hypothetical protein F4778DRAFT_731599 [Xylariomycetidae sp. FL2044]|nr:hypothetical protein F4778DRAFT_731599 [Xylariomycetidae sp. FL2044]